MFLIKGNSGCELTLLDNGMCPTVKKSCKKSYKERLSAQSRKQNKYGEFLKRHTGHKFVAPKIINEHFEESPFYFEMEYFNGLDPLIYFENSGKTKIQKFTESILLLIDKEIKECSLKDVSNDLQKKCSTTIENVRRNKSSLLKEQDLLECAQLFEKKWSSPVLLPVGISHGDLTFSNILIDDHKDSICLIDFLDSFIETPLFDIVKIRQDTKFLWTFLMHKNLRNKAKIEICFSHLDKIIHEKYNSYEWYRKHYTPSQILNMLRVDQYTTNKEVATLIKNSIGFLLNEAKNDPYNTCSR